MAKDNTLLILGAVGIGAFVLYKPLQETFSGVGSGVSKAFQGTGEGLSTAMVGLGDGINDTAIAIGDTAKTTANLVENVASISKPIPVIGQGTADLFSNAYSNIQDPDSKFRQNIEKIGDTLNPFNWFKKKNFTIQTDDKAFNYNADVEKPKSQEYYSMLPTDQVATLLNPDLKSIKEQKKASDQAKKNNNNNKRTTAGSVGLTGEEIAKLIESGNVTDKNIQDTYKKKISTKNKNYSGNTKNLSSIAKANLRKAGYNI